MLAFITLKLSWNFAAQAKIESTLVGELVWVFFDGTNSDRLEKKIHNIRIKWHWSNGNNMHKQGKKKKPNDKKNRWK